MPRTIERVREELRTNRANVSANEAVESVLDFDRVWAGYEFPRYLTAVSRIQNDVFPRMKLPPGDFTFYASRVECFFLTPVIAALDEYGIPLEVAAKLSPHLAAEDDLDVALERLAGLDLARVPSLTEFEESLVREAQESL
jgi:hypothetical protein